MSVRVLPHLLLGHGNANFAVEFQIISHWQKSIGKQLLTKKKNKKFTYSLMSGQDLKKSHSKYLDLVNQTYEEEK